MPNYPLTDPAEIAKLPPAVYETGLGAMCLSDDGVWTDFAGDRWSHTDLASSGGIAAPLVPANDYDEVFEEFRSQGEAFAECLVQRDRALELLRWLVECAEDYPEDKEFWEYHEAARTFLAEQEKTND